MICGSFLMRQQLLIALSTICILSGCISQTNSNASQLPAGTSCPVTSTEKKFPELKEVGGSLPIWITFAGRVKWSELPKVSSPVNGAMSKMGIVTDNQVSGKLVLSGRRLDGEGIVQFPLAGGHQLESGTIVLDGDLADQFIIPSAQVTDIVSSPPGYVEHSSGIFLSTPGCYEMTGILSTYKVSIVFEVTED
jgi:hypothetical protein